MTESHAQVAGRRELPAVPAVPPTRVIGPVTRTDFVRYQGASGDMNPIHHDEEFARAAGFTSPFSVGMWQAGLVGTFATDWLGAENVRSFRIRFQEQVWPGDVLELSGEVTRHYRDDDGVAKVDVELAAVRRGSGRALTVWATFVQPETGDPDA